MKGLVHIYMGDGKGKTTAAIGLGVRACGRGMKVLMVQFLKSIHSGEMCSLKSLEPNFVLRRGTESGKFTWQMDRDEKNRAAAEQQELFNCAADAARNGECDILILDEVLGAVSASMLDREQLVSFIKNKPDRLELVLTGRNADDELVGLADYVSEIRAVKHPAEKGIQARKGIEF